ncbi:MAG TPA: Imm1 family immunity protein [Actinocatenispora sp.]
MTYLLHWGRDNDRTVDTIDELDAALNEAEHQRGDADAPFMVDIVDADDPDMLTGLQIGVGHPDRGFVFYTGQTAAETGYAADLDLPPFDGEIGFDHGGQWTAYEPAKTRLTPRQVRQAASEYLRTGRRPGTLHWPRNILA